jgi:hypothetical protein
MSEDRRESPSDRAVLGVCELLGLVFALPFGDDLFRGTPITAVPPAHYAYLGIGVLWAALGPLWPAMKRKFPQSVFVSTLGRAALDARTWIFVLLILFVYLTMPASPSPSEIAAAIVHALPKQTQSATPSNSPSQTANLIAVIEATAHLPSADKEQVAKTLHDIAQLLDRMVELSDSASREVFQLGGEVFGESPKPISKEWIEIHQQSLLSLLETSKENQKALNAVISSVNGKYYESQISYVLGDKPTEKMGALRNKIDEYIHYFNSWSKIKNVEDREERGLIGYQQYPFSVAMGEIRMWGEACGRRLQEIRNAMQRN